MSVTDYPCDPNEWSEDTIRTLINEGRREDSHLEFKSRFRGARWEGDRGKEIRKEAMAFANHDGGHIVFGVYDDDDDAADGIGNVQAFAAEENPRREVSDILQKIEPQVDYVVNSFNVGGKGMVVVYVEEALRPPVTTPGEGTYYRHTENSLPMTPDQMRGMLAEFSEREAAIRQLEKELQFFFDACEHYDFTPHESRGPYFEAVNVSGLKKAIRGRHGLWQDETARKKLRGINPVLTSIEMSADDWKRLSNSDSLPTGNIGPFSSKDDRKTQTEEYTEILEEDVSRLWELCQQLVEACDLDVEIRGRP
ncbi:AlbA family DNA-binding domain-containing protein [Haloarchaeobius litoreus]|uniref:Helix-turn-helix domain-containing protein n=1 Tax=Haloarchaeobius litoreus TaxID=755306 RepID=A0ABD6DRC4_9EURY|nr:ATP-binding protein [Haloarchaeobius litoreus]